MTASDYQLLDPVDRPMRRLYGYLADFRGRIGAACAWSVTNKVLDLMPPLLTAWLVDVVDRRPPGFLAAVAGESVDAQLVAVGVLTVLVFGAESFFQWLYSLGFQRLAQDVQHRLRIDAYRAMQKREIEFFEEHRVGQTLSMLQEDVNQLERFLNSGSGLNAILQVATTCLFALVVLFSKDPALAAICLAPMPLIVWGSFAFSKRLAPRYRAVRQAAGEVTARLENNLAGILVIHSFTAEAQEAARLEAASDEYRRANRHAISV
jgi:ATP-binding cassette subfamily B protein